MPGHRPNPLDKILETITGAMTEVDDHLGRMAKDVRPFDSKELTVDEEELLFMHPAVRYEDEVEPTTGLPLTNAQAAARYLSEVGPVQYVAEIEDFVRRRDRRGKEASPDGNNG
jgi:hypothetical protein